MKLYPLVAQDIINMEGLLKTKDSNFIPEVALKNDSKNALFFKYVRIQVLIPTDSVSNSDWTWTWVRASSTGTARATWKGEATSSSGGRTDKWVGGPWPVRMLVVSLFRPLPQWETSDRDREGETRSCIVIHYRRCKTLSLTRPWRPLQPTISCRNKETPKHADRSRPGPVHSLIRPSDGRAWEPLRSSFCSKGVWPRNGPSDGLKREASVKWELSNHLTCAWHLVMVAKVSSIGWSRDRCSPSKNLKGNWAALASSWLETRETRVRILPCQWTNSGHVTTRSMSPQCLRSPMLAFTTVTVTNWAAREWTKGPTGNTQAGGLQWQQGSHSAFHIGPTIGKTWTMFFLLSIFWVIT